MVTENTYQNIIRFSFNFTRLMGIKFEDVDATYILEKWHKYFGNSVPPTPSAEFLEEWRDSPWSKRWGNFDRVAGHLYLISRINEKISTDFNKWSPEYLLECFDGTEWDEGRHDGVYDCLHMKVRQAMESWMSVHDKEMSFVMREIRLNCLLDK